MKLVAYGAGIDAGDRFAHRSALLGHVPLSVRRSSAVALSGGSQAGKKIPALCYSNVLPSGCMRWQLPTTDFSLAVGAMEPDASRLELRHVFDRFPRDANRLRRLVLSDPVLRNICEDYGLARDCLVRFETALGERHQAEIEEYRALVVELEAEIATLLHSAGGNPR